MSHRVLLNFNCDSKDIDSGSALPGRVQELLATAGWETAKDAQADGIFQRMAAELPADDLPSFVRNTKVQMLRKSPAAELTIGYFADEGVGKMRLRIRATRNAALPELGQRTATDLLSLDGLRLVNMDLFESRDSDAILQGSERADTFRLHDRRNLTVSVPFYFSLFTLVAFGTLAVSLYYGHWGWDWKFLGDTVWTWYGRLTGPLLMAVVTSLAVILRDKRREVKRQAEWEL